jgi:hypothetical protein
MAIYEVGGSQYELPDSLQGKALSDALQHITNLPKEQANANAKQFGADYGYNNVTTYNPQEEFAKSSILNKYLIGGGKALVDTGRGIGNLAREAIGVVSPSAAEATGLPTRKDIAASRANDAYINKSTAANVGNVLANIGLYGAGAELLPAANTLVGSTALGAGFGAIQPVTEEESRLKNAAVGGALNAALTTGAQGIGNFIKNKQAANAFAQDIGKTKDESLKRAVDAGYVVPPTMARGGTLSKMGESLSGGYKTIEAAQIKNQANTNRLINNYLNLPENTALGEDVLDALKTQHGQAYADIAALPSVETRVPSGFSHNLLETTYETKTIPNGATLLEKLKAARADAKDYWQAYNRSAHPTDKVTAKALDLKASKLENELEQLAIAHNQPQLVANLRQARQDLAKVYTVEKAMNGETGDVSAIALKRLYKNNVPLTGEAEQIAKFAKGFEDAAKVPKRGTATNWSPYDIGVSSIVKGKLAGLNLVGRPLARKTILSQPAQQMMANKNYALNPLESAIGNLINNPSIANKLISKTSLPVIQGSLLGNSNE